MVEFCAEYPFQLATAFWRAIEVAVIISHQFPEGLGLDLGCGEGKVTKIILKKVGSRKLVGVDIDIYGKRIAERLNIYEKIYLTSADSIPEQDGKFDFVFANSVLEHVANIEGILKEVSRMLKSDGEFLFTVPNNKFRQYLAGSIVPWVNREKYLSDFDSRCAHRRYFSIQDWQKVLAMYNLKIEKVDEYFTAQQIKRWETLSRFTSGILYNLFGKKKHPTQILNILRLRSPVNKMPRFLARIIAKILHSSLSSGVSNSNDSMGCFMISARKRDAHASSFI